MQRGVSTSRTVRSGLKAAHSILNGLRPSNTGSCWRVDASSHCASS